MSAYSQKRTLQCRWPVSVSIENAGLVDSYRVVHPSVHDLRGNTWTPRHPEDIHDRIDMIYFKGDLSVIESKRMGDGLNGADLDMIPFSGVWPSDHRAVVSTFAFGGFDEDLMPPPPGPMASAANPYPTGGHSTAMGRRDRERY